MHSSVLERGVRIALAGILAIAITVCSPDTPATENPADTPAANTAASSTETPADVLRRYYAAINARDFATAYHLWGDSGRASSQTFDEFTTGYAQTAHVELDIGTPGRIEGAAGSRYIEIPVVLRASTTDGKAQRFEGSYTLRRTVVDGASADARRWHLQSARIDRVP